MPCKSVDALGSATIKSDGMVCGGASAVSVDKPGSFTYVTGAGE